MKRITEFDREYNEPIDDEGRTLEVGDTVIDERNTQKTMGIVEQVGVSFLGNLAPNVVIVKWENGVRASQAAFNLHRVNLFFITKPRKFEAQ